MVLLEQLSKDLSIGVEELLQEHAEVSDNPR
jgi:hypothetical protein